ncbi:uncharacterized protein LOC134527962 isoform X2 [Bacillus rossius redtenbacheri]|uniref:uncharacterized protein LOC134527962 isoform X2 n=1 Tax=Bacillus rossius redtenbacheri TaxID=93214 RepID=UPI002FDEA235
MQQLAVEEAVHLRQQDAQLVETTARANQEERLRLLSELLAAETAALRSACEDLAALQKQVEELKRQHAEEVQELQGKIAATQQRNLHLTKKLSDCRNELRENKYIINLLTEKLYANGIQLEEVLGKEQQVCG